MNKKDKLEIQALCLEKKAVSSKFIDPKSIVVGHWPRLKCQYGCSAYGRTLCCPPYAPEPDETKKIIADFNIGLLVRFKSYKGLTKTIVQMEREVFLKDYHKVISFGAGPCNLCEECSLSQCKFPKLVRPSMEGCGIDVYTTARNNDYPIHALKSKDDQENCYGLILIE
jgi:predicted metal-binding protein